MSAGQAIVGPGDGAVGGCLPEHADRTAKRPTARNMRAVSLKM
jgi:hypothetical protein